MAMLSRGTLEQLLALKGWLGQGQMDGVTLCTAKILALALKALRFF